MRKGRTITLTPNPALDVWTTAPHVQPGPKLRCTPPQTDPGGGGINVSRVIHRLGGETLALFPAGGVTGEALSRALDREGVPARCAPTQAATRQSFSVRDELSKAVYRFVLPGDPIGVEEQDSLLALLAETAADAAIVVGSGSLPPGAGADFWARAARISRQAGAYFILDSGDGAREALQAGVDLYRENTSAIAALDGRPIAWPLEAAEWARQRIAAGQASMVIVTEGARGALMVEEGTATVLAPPQVEIASAIGAGDSFVGAFSLAMSRGEPAQAALRRAVATSTATLLSPATQLCDPADVDRLLPLVTAVPLA